MPGFNNHKGAYSGDDIMRYLKGEMSPEQMHALEKAALNDPFLAEAIEGYEWAIDSTGQENINTALQSLKAAIDKRSSPAKRVVSYYSWIRIAAAAVVIIAAGIFTYKRLLPSRNESALAEKSSAAIQEITSAAPEELKKNTDAPAVDAEPSAAAPLPSTALQDKASARQESSPKQKLSDDNKTASGNLRKNTEQFYYKKHLAEQEESDHAQEMDSVIALGYSKARPAGNDKKEVSLAARKAELKEKADLPAPVASDDQLSKALSGKAAGISIKKEAYDAIPETGWADYETYITANKKNPLIDTLKNGEVILSFWVRAKGKPENITIEKSLSPYYDKEAIRLLREGPSWKLLKSRKAKVSITIHF